MTYKELLNQLSKLNEEQLNTDVTVCDSYDEFFKVKGLYFIDPKFDDVLDPGHPYFLFNQLNQ